MPEHSSSGKSQLWHPGKLLKQIIVKSMKWTKFGRNVYQHVDCLMRSLWAKSQVSINLRGHISECCTHIFWTKCLKSDVNWIFPYLPNTELHFLRLWFQGSGCSQMHKRLTRNWQKNQKQARKARRCDSIRPETINHSLTHWHQSPPFILVRKQSCPTSGFMDIVYIVYFSDETGRLTFYNK